MIKFQRSAVAPFWRLCSTILALVILFSVLFMHGVHPEQFKKSRTGLLDKNENRLNPAKYRLITIGSDLNELSIMRSPEEFLPERRTKIDRPLDRRIWPLLGAVGVTIIFAA